MPIILPRGIHLDRNRDVVADSRNFPGLYCAGQTHIWKRGSFTVPAEVSEQTVQDAAHRYKKKFGEALEKQGFEVLGFDGPRVDDGVVMNALADPDRRCYRLWAKVRRRPVVATVDVSDTDIPLFLEAGFRHKERKVW